MHNHTDNYTFLTSGPIPRVILTMAVPTIISMLVTSIYNIADTFFVGHLDTQATAAVGVVFSLMFMTQAFGFFFGHGSGNYISRELGAKRHGNAERMAVTGFVYSFLFGCIIAIGGHCLLTPLSYWLGSTPTILPYTKQYLGIILIGAPFLTSSLTLNNQMRLQGNASLAMYGIVTGAIVNVALDPVFIFGLNMGVRGAALSTVIGQILSFCILLCMTYRGENIPIRLKNFWPGWQPLREIFYGGSPSLSRQGLTAISTLLLNQAAGNYGDAAIAAMSIVGRISTFIISVVIGTGQGFQPFCGFCYGARLYTRLRKGYWFTVKVGTAFLIFCSLLTVCFSSTAISIFRNDANVISIGGHALILQLCTWCVTPVIMVSNMLLQTCRKPFRANVLASARSGLFFIPAILIFPHWLGLLGIEIAQPVSDIFSFFITVPIVLGFFRELKKMENHS